MNATGKRLLVILISFAVVGMSGLATYTTWVLLPGVMTIERGVISLFSWIATFYIGVFLFWKTILRVA